MMCTPGEPEGRKRRGAKTWNAENIKIPAMRTLRHASRPPGGYAMAWLCDGISRSTGQASKHSRPSSPTNAAPGADLCKRETLYFLRRGSPHARTGGPPSERPKANIRPMDSPAAPPCAPPGPHPHTQSSRIVCEASNVSTPPLWVMVKLENKMSNSSCCAQGRRTSGRGMRGCSWLAIAKSDTMPTGRRRGAWKEVRCHPCLFHHALQDVKIARLCNWVLPGLPVSRH